MKDDDVADALEVIRERRPTGGLSALPAPAWIPAERPFEDGGGSGGGTVIFLPNVDGYTESGTALDSVTTKGKPVGTLYIFKHASDNLCFFKLEEGDDAEELPKIVRPADFDAVTNAKIFRNLLDTLRGFVGVDGIVKQSKFVGVVIG